MADTAAYPRDHVISQWIIQEFETDTTSDVAMACARVLVALALERSEGNRGETKKLLHEVFHDAIVAVDDVLDGRSGIV